MSLPEHELYRCHDQWGAIRVLESENLRYLAFGEGGDQSAVDLLQPSRPILLYIQAMLLALVYSPAPKNITLLGLGAGNLANALLHCLPDAQITAVELRPRVIKVAHKWFALPKTPRLNILADDASEYMLQSDEPVDMLFSDIYLDQGMDDNQLSFQVLQACYDSLSPAGMLVLNLWDQGKGHHPLAHDRLGEYFGKNYLLCPVEGGNLIAFAFKEGLSGHNPRRLQQQVKRLSKSLGVNLGPLLNQVKAG
ncbi:MAG: spermidine synthase [Pontibacterium sp.]